MFSLPACFLPLPIGVFSRKEEVDLEYSQGYMYMLLLLSVLMHDSVAWPVTRGEVAGERGRAGSG